jgi:hypothetical protein
MSLRRDLRESTRPSRSLSARARILGAILAVACIGLAIVGSVTFLVQRERVLGEVNDRLRAQVDRLITVTGETARSRRRPAARRRSAPRSPSRGRSGTSRSP